MTALEEIQATVDRVGRAADRCAESARSLALTLIDGDLAAMRILAAGDRPNGGAPDEPAPESPASPEPEAGAPSVLLVEDDGFVAGSTCRILRAAGFNVTHVRTARAACEILERERWVAVICDMILDPGGCQGSAVAAEAVEAGLPLVILWTGHDPDAARLHEIRDALAARAAVMAAEWHRVPTAVLAYEKIDTLAQDLVVVIGGAGGGTSRKT